MTEASSGASSGYGHLPSGVTVGGLSFSALSAGIRKDGRADVALAVADRPATVAAVLTRNLVRAAPVLVTEARVRAGSARAIVVNSGCANACTGEPGVAAAHASTEAVARVLRVEPEAVLPASTGVIGALLPADKIASRAGDLVDGLRPDGWEAFARAIMTTDRWPKVAAETVSTAEGPITLLAIAKGAGMIHPDMGPPHATMLGFVFTDAVVDQPTLASALAGAVDVTFNACTVDGDTSTNDCVIALATGATGRHATRAQLEPALFSVCDALARSMVADGEGASHVAEIRVAGLANDADARAIARTVATSLLVKTALFGEDANWGRLLAAAGRSGVHFDPTRAAIAIGGIDIVLGVEAEQRAAVVLKARSYTIDLSLGDGPGRGRYLTSDLGHGYVDVNAGYRS